MGMTLKKSVLAVALAMATALAVADSPASGLAAGPERAVLASHMSGQSVTLITGDRVILTRSAHGRDAVAVDPGPGRDSLLFQHHRDGAGHVVVIPEDVRAPLAAGRLDRRLFDVTALAEQGFDDAHSRDVQLLVSFTAGRSAPAAVRTSGARISRDLPRLRMSAVTEPKRRAGEFWRTVRGAQPDAPTLAPGVAKVWLNARVAASLDQSVPQIGAPEVWRDGLRGDGVTVAVLDSGYDATHPDLVGAVDDARGFTDAGGQDVTDQTGHGTHVASIIAGRGTASGGRYTGTAPGAKLLVGKVLGDDGHGFEDWIIAGMQWAVDRHARVVNMSLGGPPTDGTDPLSEAINQLSRESGTLFVVAAGNDGTAGSVGTPGAADAALTVGSVTKTDDISAFSSQGPRVGDDAVKPDVTAPGSDIVAARAAGTPDGDRAPVNDHYARLSGTSMAAPHVAGAAALLAAKHPDWRADRLKTALMTTARPATGHSVYAQGAGRIDVGAAARQPISTDVGSLSFGRFSWPYSAQRSVTKKITFRNDGSEPETLTLGLGTRDSSGAPAPGGVFSVAPASLTVPAGGTATAAVTVDPTDAAPGLFGGALTATSAGGQAVRIVLGASFEVESYHLTLRTLGRDGRPTDLVDLGVLPADPSSPAQYPFPDADGQAVLRLPKGEYAIAGFIATPANDGSAASATAVIQPKFDIGGDTTVTLDARAGQPVEVRVAGEPTARQVLRSDAIAYRLGTTTFEFGAITGGDLPFYAVGARDIEGLDYYTFATWARPDLTLTVSAPEQFELPVRYADTSPRVTGDRTYRVVDAVLGRPEDLTKVDVRGKLVLLRLDDSIAPAEQLDAVVRAGATAALYPQSGIFPLPFFEPTAVPVLATRASSFYRLAALSAADPATVQIHGYAERSPYSYHLAAVEHRGLPAGAVRRFDRTRLATVDTRYRALGEPSQGSARLFDFPRGFPGFVSGLTVDLPMRRLSYYTPGEWFAHFHLDGADAIQASEPVTYRPRDWYHSEWNVPVIGPKLVPVPTGTGADVPAALRSGNTISTVVRGYSDATAGRYGLIASAYDSGTLRLSRNGQEIGEPGRTDRGEWQVPADTATYQLRLDSVRDSPAWPLSTRTSATWTFRSTPTDGALPLLVVSCRVPLDESNTARAGHQEPFTISVARQPMAKPATIDRVRAWSSFDEGRTWQALTVYKAADGWRVTPPSGGRSGDYVSLRVSATDTDGNAVDQTTIRAYRLR
ncbi:S8 family serine peptidase [Plantactinospora sp. B6F1]|uniref:S8 family serine peptidase n=1 Tax=Plantactinospora sp. B6F1 TaxID=3158971 RepID=UPI0032D9583A